MTKGFRLYSGLFIMGLLISLVMAGCSGSTGPAGISNGNITGNAIDTATSKPLSGALITSVPAVFSATTDAKGSFSVRNVPIGVYRVTASMSGYISQTTGYISIVAGKTMDIPFKLSTLPIPKTMVVANAGKNQWNVGYDKDVTIDASASTSNSGKALTYTWKQVINSASGQVALPPVTFLNGTSSATLKLKLPSLQVFFSSLDVPVKIPDKFGMLAISPWMGGGTSNESNIYGFELTVSDGTNTSTTTVYVSPASTTSGLKNVPIGITQYLDGGTQTSWNWQVVSAPDSSDVTALTNPTSQTPSFIPDLTGQYVFKEGVSGLEITVTAGTYVGWQQCAQCHNGNISGAPVTVEPWLGTGHATMLTKMINGNYQDDDDYTSRCAVCHTLGDTPEETAPSNGWWDAYLISGWTFPVVANNYSYAVNKDNWNKMPQSLKNLSNIQCENCHGPGSVHTGTKSYNQSVCFQCHDNTDDEDVPNTWRTSAHAQSLTAAGGYVTKNASCVKCHVSQEIVSANFEGNTPTTVTNPYPINCAACHDPHSAANPNQLRVYGSETIAGGTFTLTNIGAGAICTACHTDETANPNTGIQNALLGAETPTEATTIHHSTAELFAAGQGFTLTGAGAYAASIVSSPHAAGALSSLSGKDLCVTCHMYDDSGTYFTLTTGNHSFAMSDELNDATDACKQCHTVDASATNGSNTVTGFDTIVNPLTGSPIPNWDGGPTSVVEGVQDRVQGLLSVLACAITTTSITGNQGTCSANTVDAAGNPVVWSVAIPTGRGIANVISPSNGTAGFTFTSVFTQKELDAVYNYNVVNQEGSMGVHNTKFDVELLQKAFNDLTGGNIPNVSLY